MADPDYDNMSLEELQKIAGGGADPEFDNMSDEELERLANPPSAVESGLHGALSGVTAGFMDELSGAGEAVGRAVGIKGMSGEFGDQEFAAPNFEFSKNYEEGRDKKRALHKALKEANPDSYLTGEVGGGVASFAVPAIGAARGSALAKGVVSGAKALNSGATGARAAIGAGAGLGGLTGIGNSEAEDAKGLTVDTLTGMGIGAAGGGAGFGVGKGIEKGANFVTQKAGPLLSKMLPIGKKANAKDIEAAAKALGFKATPGMTNASETVQKLESSLHQAPTIGGWLTRRGTKPAVKGMQDATGDLVSDAATVSPFESGEQVKKILSKEVEAKFKPSIDTFDELRGYTKDIHATPASVKRVSQNIMNIPEVKTLELPLAKQIIKQLNDNPSVDQIKILRTMVGAEAKASQGAQKSAYWQLYAKLGRLEENTLKRGVIASARTKGEGDTIAKGMLGQLKGAKKGYSEQMGNLEDMSQAARLGRVNDGPKGFIDKVDSIPSERLQEKLLPLEDVRLAQTMQKQFPEAFGGLRKARIRDLAEGTFADNEHLPGQFLKNTKGLHPEAETMLFGDKAKTLSNLRTVNQALPDKVGPSGTQQAQDMEKWWRPDIQARDLVRFAGYKGASSDKLASVAKFLRSQPSFANMAESNPKAFQAAVYQFAQKVNPEGGAYKAAGFNPQEPVDDEKAKQSFLEGN